MAITETQDEFRSENGRVSVSKMTAAVRYESCGKIAINVAVNSNGSGAHVSIYGDPDGLLDLADLLIAFAKVDQKGVSSRNCPDREGVHTSLNTDNGLLSQGVDLHIGRLDAKGMGADDWFTSNPVVSIVDDER